jgi:hypothetical protein
MLFKVKLITSYLNNPRGTIYETDKEKAEQLVSLKRAEWAENPKVTIKKEKDRLAKEAKRKSTKQMKPRRKSRYFTK